MNVIILLSIVVILIAYFAQFKNAKYMLELSFVIIFLFTALRYDYGKDYMNYYKAFMSIKSHSLSYSINNDVLHFEIGWLIINYLFRPIGFFGLIFTLSAFFCYTYYSLIKKYVTVNYYWFAVLIYVFLSDIMFVQFSAIRQGLSIAIFIYSIRYLIEKRNEVKYLNIVKYILLNIVSGYIHTSGFFLILLVFFAFPTIQKSKYTGYIILILYFLFLLFGSVFYQYFLHLSLFFGGDKYNVYFDNFKNKQITLIGSLFWTVYIIIVIYYSRFQSRLFKVVLLICSLYFLVYPISNSIVLSNRLGYYFAPFCAISFPIILKTEKNSLLRFGLFALFLIFIFYNLKYFMSMNWVNIGYKNYQTIFSIL